MQGSLYHAIQVARHALLPGTTCVVIGVGGLGHMAIQILAATTAVRIVALDVKTEALDVASHFGAHETSSRMRMQPKAIREIAGPPPGGADVVLDFVGAPSLKIAASVVSMGGWLVLVGLAGGELKLSPGVGATGVPFETRVVIPFWGTRAELAEVIALARDGRISARIERFSLPDAQTAYDKLRAGQLNGRAVILPAAG